MHTRNLWTSKIFPVLHYKAQVKAISSAFWLKSLKAGFVLLLLGSEVNVYPSSPLLQEEAYFLGQDCCSLPRLSL